MKKAHEYPKPLTRGMFTRLRINRMAIIMVKNGVNMSHTEMANAWVNT